MERAFDWNDTIENDGEFKLLPEGDYDFTVQSFERGRFNGSEKMSACPMAILSIRVSGPAGATTLSHNLFLHSKSEWALCAFFTAIGHRKSGEPLRMDWSKVSGSSGRCKLGVRKWMGKDGQERESNEINRFYEPDAAAAPAFTPGNF